MMASSATGNEEYFPADLFFNEFFVNSPTATFFSNQSRSTGPISSFTAATTYNTPSKGSSTEQSSKSSSLTQIRKESNDVVVSAPTFSRSSTAFTGDKICSNLSNPVNGVNASRCAPNSDIQFQPIGRPVHLGTVAARRCIPNPISAFSRSFDRPDTVIAAPIPKPQAEILSSVSSDSCAKPPTHGPFNTHVAGMLPYQQYAHFSTVSAGAVRAAHPPAVPVYSSQSYESCADLGYSSSYSMRDHHSSYHLPDVTKPTPESWVSHQYQSSEYECSGFGTYLNALKPTTIEKDGLSRKRFRGMGQRCNVTAMVTPKSEKSSPRKKRKYTKRKKAPNVEAGHSANGSSINSTASDNQPTFSAQQLANAGTSGFSTTKQEVYSKRNVMAFETGQFLVEIGDMHNSDCADKVLWCVQSCERLQKYILNDMDWYKTRTYAKSDSFCAFISNESWRYYPLNANTVRLNKAQESVIVSTFPSKEEIKRYQMNMSENPSKRNIIQHSDANILPTGENVLATPNFYFMNDTD